MWAAVYQLWIKPLFSEKVASALNHISLSPGKRYNKNILFNILKFIMMPGITVLTFNPSTQDMETERFLWVKVQPDLQTEFLRRQGYINPVSKKKNHNKNKIYCRGNLLCKVGKLHLLIKDYEFRQEIGKWKFWYREQISGIECKAMENFTPNADGDGWMKLRRGTNPMAACRIEEMGY